MAETIYRGYSVIIDMETITIAKEEYKDLKKKAELGEDLIIKLVRGLEDIRAGRIHPWKKTTANQASS